MKTDAQLKDDVTEELRWDPQISDADAIAVGVTDGAVTLAGHVPGYAEKMATARAAERVNGVRAVASDLKVQLPGAPRDDAGIAEAIAHVLQRNVQVPGGRVHAEVEHGRVTLEGDADHDYQRREVDRTVRHAHGVTRLMHGITVTPPANPAQVHTLTEETSERQAEADAVHIRVEVTGHTAKLYGQAHSLPKANAARQAAAASSPGVTTVESHLAIAP